MYFVNAGHANIPKLHMFYLVLFLFVKCRCKWKWYQYPALWGFATNSRLENFKSLYLLVLPLQKYPLLYTLWLLFLYVHPDHNVVLLFSSVSTLLPPPEFRFCLSFSKNLICSVLRPVVVSTSFERVVCRSSLVVLLSVSLRWNPSTKQLSCWISIP